MTDFEKVVDLSCHASTRTQILRAISVVVRRSVNDELKFTFRLDGDLSRIQIPSANAPRFATDLWRHTCFEVFSAVDGHPGYHEFNFSPSGDWAIYAFNSYRNGGPVNDETMRPRIVSRTSGDRFELNAHVPVSALSAIHSRVVLRLGLAAVIEANNGLSYWALHHPSDRPDFH